MTFGDSLDDKEATLSDVKDLVQGLLVDIQEVKVAPSPPESVTSTSATLYTNCFKAVVLTSGQSFVAWANINVSHSSAGERIYAEIHDNSGKLSMSNQATYFTSRANTAGADATLSPIAMRRNPGAGVWTVELKWLIATGTGYSNGAHLLVAVFQTD